MELRTLTPFFRHPLTQFLTISASTDTRQSKKRKRSKHIVSPLLNHEFVAVDSDDDTDSSGDNYLVQAGLAVAEHIDYDDVHLRKT